MKICPKCSQTYGDETLNYCLMDGEVLRPIASTSEGPERTAILSQPDLTAQNRPFGEQQTARYSIPPPQKKSRIGLWLVLFFATAIVLIGGGIVALIGFGIYRASSAQHSTKTPLPPPSFSPYPALTPVPAPS